MAKTNYRFEKKQRELNKAKKQEAKRQKRQANEPDTEADSGSPRPAQ